MSARLSASMKQRSVAESACTRPASVSIGAFVPVKQVKRVAPARRRLLEWTCCLYCCTSTASYLCSKPRAERQGTCANAATRVDLPVPAPPYRKKANSACAGGEEANCACAGGEMAQQAPWSVKPDAMYLRSSSPSALRSAGVTTYGNAATCCQK
jgi:hypothetical protein